MSDRQPALTPCLQICVIHEDSGLCTGCYRTRAEIAGWAGMNNDERRALMDTLPSRAKLLMQRRGGRGGRIGRLSGKTTG
ncbi:MAG: DUF1289 domain-containing protein [Rhodobacterales bacterium CG2_30_65_12]|nr:MAG: DUF1289 domain-containing protein [Rhodobacterales bacterium CG2_30_65_12]